MCCYGVQASTMNIPVATSTYNTAKQTRGNLTASPSETHVVSQHFRPVQQLFGDFVLLHGPTRQLAHCRPGIHGFTLHVSSLFNG